MLVEAIDRGNVVEFTATFYDAAGEVVVPASAKVTINYLDSAGARASTHVDMDAETAGSWFATWSTADAQPARVYWSVQSSGPASAQDGLFDLKGNLANLANPDPDA